MPEATTPSVVSERSLNEAAARAVATELGGQELELLADRLDAAGRECVNASRAELGRDLRELAGLIRAQV